jgi:8-amino-7-oxononanoate synthase
VLHERLEEVLCALKGAEATLVYATGSMANIGAITALIGKRDTVYKDALVHATIHDGARLSGAEQRVFAHNDMSGLEALLEADRGRGGRRLVAVDGVYSMDGDTARLPQLRELCMTYGAMLLVDDAHGTGVLGAGGQGTLAHYGLLPWDGLVLVGTLSKALGSLGGFVSGPRVLRDYLTNKSRSFIFATGLAPPCVGAALEALRIVRDEPERRQNLWALRERLQAGLTALGVDTFGSETPIVPVRGGRPDNVLRLQAALWNLGVYAPAIRPPSVPRDACRIRLTVTAAHTAEQVDHVLNALESIVRKDDALVNPLSDDMES